MKSEMNCSATLNQNDVINISNVKISTIHKFHDSKFLLSGGFGVLTKIYIFEIIDKKWTFLFTNTILYRCVVVIKILQRKPF
jgi:hypothetical protein